MTAAICVFAALVILFVSQSARFSHVHVSGPIAFLVAGGVVGATLVDAQAEGSAIQTLAEATLVLVLFHDVAELQPRELRADSAFTGRLLFVGLPLTIGAGFLLARALFPEIGVWLALFLAAALALTDAGLGAATVLNPVVPARVRRIPQRRERAERRPGDAGGPVRGGRRCRDRGATRLGTASAPPCWSSWSVSPPASGWGFSPAASSSGARDRGWADRALLPIATLAVPLLCYYGAPRAGRQRLHRRLRGGHGLRREPVHRRGGARDRRSDRPDIHVPELRGLDGLRSHRGGRPGAAVHSGQNVVFAVLSLTVLRIVPVALSLFGVGLRLHTVGFIGWLGPRGLASVIFGLIALESLDDDPAVATALGVITTTVVLSVIAHGVTASPWAERYGAWAARTRPAIETTRTVEPLHRHGGSRRAARH